LAEAAINRDRSHAQRAALEFDLGSGKRGERDDHRGLLCELTGAEDATIVNNNAAAICWCSTLWRGRGGGVARRADRVGGAFRMPDIMARAGASWSRSAPPTAPTLKDYVAAIGPKAGLC
jgi:L-seryl-tRNA(Ser) seleniumtransferase